MQVSIVTPAFNAERWLASTLESVLAQTHTHWNYIVVDDDSRDATSTIATEFARRDARIRVHRQVSGSPAKTRNTGIRLLPATAEAVIFLDADDLWQPRTLELLIHGLKAAGSAPAVHGRAEGIDAQGDAIVLTGYEQQGRRYVRPGSAFGLRPMELGFLGDNEATSFAALALFNPISTPGQVLIRRSALDRVGVFDVQLKAAEDWDLWLRLALLAPLAYLPETVVYYRRHGANLSSQHAKARAADLYVRHKALKSTAASHPEAHTAARLGLRYAELERCTERLRRATSEFAKLRLVAGVQELGRASRSLLECAQSLR